LYDNFGMAIVSLDRTMNFDLAAGELPDISYGF
jgi:hypothetical protein